jgi:hypothetical protein
VIHQPTSDGSGKAVQSRHCPRNCKRQQRSARFKPLFHKGTGRRGTESKDEGGRMKDEVKAFKNNEKHSFHPSSFRLHPCF